MAEKSDSALLDFAVQLKLLTPEQVEEARKLKVVFADNGVVMSLPEIFQKKEWLSRTQVRALNILMRYENLKADDERFGRFMADQGFVAQEKVDECLALQKKPYEEGKTIPRLHELLLKKKYITTQQLQIIHRARLQIQPKVQTPAQGSGVMPAVKIPIQDDVPSTKPPPDTRKIKRKAAPAVAEMQVDGCRCTMRSAKISDSHGREINVAVLYAEGVIDGHTFRHFDEYLANVVGQGYRQVVLNFEKLDYVSSAGIGTLAGSIKKCRDAKGDLRLCNVQDKVKKIINLVGLQSMLKLYDKEEAAVQSFKFL